MKANLPQQWMIYLDIFIILAVHRFLKYVSKALRNTPLATTDINTIQSTSAMYRSHDVNCFWDKPLLLKWNKIWFPCTCVYILCLSKVMINISFALVPFLVRLLPAWNTVQENKDIVYLKRFMTQNTCQTMLMSTAIILEQASISVEI